METQPGDWLSLLILTFVLGLKHGFDADHLATIDGLTRYNARTRPGMARYCGTFFSLGHGAVVMAIALGVSALAGRWGDRAASAAEHFQIRRLYSRYPGRISALRAAGGGQAGAQG